MKIEWTPSKVRFTKLLAVLLVLLPSIFVWPSSARIEEAIADIDGARDWMARCRKEPCTAGQFTHMVNDIDGAKRALEIARSWNPMKLLPWGN